MAAKRRRTKKRTNPTHRRRTTHRRTTHRRRRSNPSFPFLETLMAMGGGAAVGLGSWGLDNTKVKNWQSAAIEGVGGAILGLIVGAFSKPLGASIAGAGGALAVKRLIWEYKVKQATKSQTTPQVQQSMQAVYQLPAGQNAPAYYQLPQQQMGAVGAPVYGGTVNLNAIGAPIRGGTVSLNGFSRGF